MQTKLENLSKGVYSVYWIAIGNNTRPFWTFQIIIIVLIQVDFKLGASEKFVIFFFIEQLAAYWYELICRSWLFIHVIHVGSIESSIPISGEVNASSISISQPGSKDSGVATTSRSSSCSSSADSTDSTRKRLRSKYQQPSLPVAPIRRSRPSSLQGLWWAINFCIP